MSRSENGSDDESGAGDETLAAPPSGASHSGAGALASPLDASIKDYPGLVPVDPDHYVIGHELARGGMGRILSVRDRRLGRVVALKELLIRSPEMRARFEREVRITAKLQHPSIVSVLEAGTWPSGEPFYAMKLVAGRSLDQVIAAAHGLDERLALLPNLIAVFDALAYAHSAHVIHRDLKPSNVLVGEFGETVVIDWGLAKDQRDTSAALALPHTLSATTTPEVTVAGAVMGTPSYMAPEQARGEVVDARADVFALGAMLYHLLTGRPPYVGATTHDVLASVLSGPPEPVKARSGGAPAELVTIVEKAMARQPEDRYAMANALAEDLRRFQTGQLVNAHRYSSGQLLRRWLRRHRTAVAVAGVAFTLLVGLGTFSVQRILKERRLTEQQRQVAVRSRKEAESLMGFMLGDLRDKLQPLGKLDLLHSVADRAVAYYAEPAEHGTDEEQRQRSVALFNIGDVLADEDHLTAALEQDRASLAIRERLLAAAPTSADRAASVVEAQLAVGNVLYKQRHFDGASTAFRTARDIAVRLAAEQPSLDSMQKLSWRAQSRFAELLVAKGDLAAAREGYVAALDLAERRARADAHDPLIQRDLTIALEGLGAILERQGDSAGALTQYEASLRIGRKLLAVAPEDARTRRDLSVTYELIGTLLYRGGDKKRAMEPLRESKALLQALVAADPTNANYQRELAGSEIGLGAALRDEGDLAGAIAAFRAASDISVALAAKDPSDAGAQREVGVSEDNLANALLDHGDIAAALEAYRKDLAIDRKRAAADPASPGVQFDLSFGYTGIGNALAAERNLHGALEAKREALELREKLVARDPSNAWWADALAESRTEIGDLLRRTRDRDGALKQYDEAVSILERLAANDPKDAARAKKLSECLRKRDAMRGDQGWNARHR